MNLILFYAHRKTKGNEKNMNKPKIQFFITIVKMINININ